MPHAKQLILILFFFLQLMRFAMDRAGFSKKYEWNMVQPSCYGPLRMSKAQECPDWNVSFHFFSLFDFPLFFGFYYKN